MPLSTQQRGLLLLSFGRLVALGMSLFIIFNGDSAETISELFRSKEILAISFTIVATILQIKLICFAGNISKIGFLQILFDVVLISLSSKLSGDVHIFPMYVVLIVCASLLLNAKSSILVAAFSGICYPISFSAASLPAYSSMQIFIAYVSLVIAALLGIFYSRQIEGLKHSLFEKEKELIEVNLDKSNLIESFSEGVVTLDLNSAITGINDAAKALLGLRSYSHNETVGVSINEAINKSSLKDKRILHELKNGDSKDVISVNLEEETTLKVCLQELKDRNGFNRGKVLFISDVGEFRNIEERLQLHEDIAKIVGAGKVELDNSKNCYPGLVGTNELLNELLLVVQQASPTDAAVLILGESGTGKELVASAIHSNSRRSTKPFVVVNCGAIPENLLESELFGHKKGAFTGADRDTLGLFREADGGTLFLDEIGEMPIHLQAKILRALQEKKVRPVGSSKEVDVNVRIIAATNRNLKELVRENKFREDLFYRLRVIELIVPPLRLRKDDIPALTFHFLKKDGIDPENFNITSEAWELLLNYNYPGNIRELENIINRGKVLGNGAILPEHLPEEVRLFRDTPNKPTDQKPILKASRLPFDLEKHLEEIEVAYLLESLNQTNGMKKEAAKLLGLNFRSFRYRLKKYDLSIDDDSDDNLATS